MSALNRQGRAYCLRAAILICSFWAARAPSSTAATRSLSDHPPFSDFYLTET
jgi:hypothetical protein